MKKTELKKTAFMKNKRFLYIKPVISINQDEQI